MESPIAPQGEWRGERPGHRIGSNESRRLTLKQVQGSCSSGYAKGICHLRKTRCPKQPSVLVLNVSAKWEKVPYWPTERHIAATFAPRTMLRARKSAVTAPAVIDLRFHTDTTPSPNLVTASPCTAMQRPRYDPIADEFARTGAPVPRAVNTTQLLLLVIPTSLFPMYLADAR